jgi:hypothetical protein
MTKLELLYDWQFTANQFILVPSALRIMIKDLFLHLNPCGHSPYVTSSLTRGWVHLFKYRLCLYQVYVSHISHVIENSPLCTIYMFYVSPGFAKHIMFILLILYYNDSLVTSMVIRLTAAKFMTLIFSVWFHLVLCCNIFILMIFYDFCLLSAHFCYIIIYIWKVKSRVQIVAQCAPWKIFSDVNLVLQVLQF